jgi:hypothetical protein
MTTAVELNDMSAVSTDAEPAGGSGGGIPRLKDAKEKTAGRKSNLNRVQFSTNDNKTRQFHESKPDPGAQQESARLRWDTDVDGHLDVYVKVEKMP